MRNTIFTILGFILVTNILQSQITYIHQVIDEPIFVEDNDLTLKPTQVCELFGLRDMDNLKSHSTALMKDSIQLLKLHMDLYLKKLPHQDTIFYSCASNYFSSTHKTSIVQYTSKHTGQKINTQYYFRLENELPVITNIVIYDDDKLFIDFPELHTNLTKEQIALRISQGLENTKKRILIREAIIKNAQTSIQKESGYFGDTKTDLARLYGGLAWDYALDNNGLNTIVNAQRGLEVHPESKWIYTNLALGYLLENNFDAAKKIYRNNYSTMVEMGGKSLYLKYHFLNDLAELENYGITHKNIPLARTYLNNLSL